jgi:hypothetical protein
MTAVVIFSFLFASSRGLVWNWLRSLRNRQALRARAVLADLHALAMQHPDGKHGHSVGVLRAMSANPGGVPHALGQLRERDLAREMSPGVWVLTDEGLAEAGKNGEEAS